MSRGVSSRSAGASSRRIGEGGFALVRGAPGTGKSVTLSILTERLPAKSGRKAHDYEYKRDGVANFVMMFAPSEGWWQVRVTDRHTAID
jgi:hypothetical protein